MDEFESKTDVGNKSEIEQYLSDGREARTVDFDVLNWWKMNASKYPILGHIARDVMAMPISTFSSESAFSTGGRVLDPFRSSLSPKTVEALICTQNWLREEPNFDIQQALDSIENFEVEEGNLLI
jgi:hypothetical protein